MNTAALLVVFGGFFLIAQYLQLVLGLSPLQAGLWTLPSAAGFIVGSLLAPAIVRRVPPSLVVAGGLALAAAGFALLTQVEGASGLPIVVGGSVLLALGAAPVVTLSTDLIVAAAPPERAGWRRPLGDRRGLGGALGIVLGSIGTAVYRSRISDAVPAGVPPEAAESARDTLGAAVGAAGELPARLLDAASDAFAQGLQVAAVVSAALLAALAALALRLLRDAGGAFDPRPDDITPREEPMFTKTRAFSGFAVPDIAAARRFYGETLGLEVTEEGDAIVLQIAGGRPVLVYPKDDHVPATYTILNFPVADIERAVDDLAAAGVRFESYTGELQTDERGIFRGRARSSPGSATPRGTSCR